MALGKFVSYLRVSTKRQGESGLGLEAQRKAVEDYLNGGNWELVTEFVEIESGKDNARPKLAEALHRAKATGARLLIAKLDRLSRNVAFIANLQESRVKFVYLSGLCRTSRTLPLVEHRGRGLTGLSSAVAALHSREGAFT